MRGRACPYVGHRVEPLWQAWYWAGAKPDVPDGPRGHTAPTSANVNCFGCGSGSTELLEYELLVGAPRIYRCSQCGYVDWVELPPGQTNLTGPATGLHLRSVRQCAVVKTNACAPIAALRLSLAS